MLGAKGCNLYGIIVLLGLDDRSEFEFSHFQLELLVLLADFQLVFLIGYGLVGCGLRDLFMARRA